MSIVLAPKIFPEQIATKTSQFGINHMLYVVTNNVRTLQRVNSISAPNDSNYERKIHNKSLYCLQIIDVSAASPAISWLSLNCLGYLSCDKIRFIYMLASELTFEPRGEKSGHRGFRPDTTPTGLL